jgi:hypothetical protein
MQVDLLVLDRLQSRSTKMLSGPAAFAVRADRAVLRLEHLGERELAALVGVEDSGVP